MARTELFSRKQPGGVFTIEAYDRHPGAVFFVDDSGTDSANRGKNPDAPLATIDYAIGLCTDSAGDVIYVAPGHAETVTAAITCDKIGISIIGLGNGRLRPAITASGAIDLMTITAANVTVKNLRLLGAAADVTALVNLAAADATLDDLVFEPGATPTSTITVAAGAHRFHLKNFKVLSSANGPAAFVNFETGVDNWIIENGFINFCVAGLDTAVFYANTATCAGGIIKGVTAIGLDAACLFVDFNSSSAVGEGIIQDCAWQNRAAATIANILDLGGYATARIAGADGPVRGAILLPATSAS